MLSALDESSRERLALEVAPRLREPDAVRVFERIVQERTFPAFVRLDSGPEFISNALACSEHRAQTGPRLLQPESRWLNGCVESVNAILRKK